MSAEQVLAALRKMQQAQAAWDKQAPVAEKKQRAAFCRIAKQIQAHA